MPKIIKNDHNSIGKAKSEKIDAPNNQKEEKASEKLNQEKSMPKIIKNDHKSIGKAKPGKVDAQNNKK